MIFSSVGGVVQEPTKESILVLEMEGVIFDGKKLLREIREYAPKEYVKGIIVRVNSPGGAVGPSQELYTELKRVRTELNKPVYISANAVMASGAFYAAMGASKIYANTGSLLGSIGVIMNFANLEDLYSWAKIKRFNLSTGKFKDTGADFRSMKEEEKQYLQDLLEETLDQFVADILSGRPQMKEAFVREVADGRVFTGTFAREKGFIDETGSMTEAIAALGEETGLGKTPNLLYPKKSPEEFFEMLSQSLGKVNPAENFEEVFKTKLIGRPLFLLPQYVNH